MAIFEQPEEPITLRANVLDMGLIHLLESQYTVLVEQRDSNIVIELYNK